LRSRDRSAASGCAQADCRPVHAASLRLEAFATGQPLFFLVARDADSTLLLPGRRDRNACCAARPDQVLEALTGLRVTRGLRMTLTGCAPDEGVANARASGDWRIVPGQTTSYLRRENATARGGSAPPPVSAGVEWRAEYKRFVSGLPTEIRLTSTVDRRFDLQLTLPPSQIDAAASLGPEVFRLEIPAGAQPITLEELRANGPLGPTQSK
jgi:hypothetical protein